MSDQPETTAECAHHWVSQHEPGHLLYWVKVCSQCHQPDWKDLDVRIARLTGKAEADTRAEIASGYERRSAELRKLEQESHDVEMVANVLANEAWNIRNYGRQEINLVERLTPP